MRNLEANPVHEWSVSDVSEWLKETGFGNLAPQFQEHDIDGKVLLLLTEEDLRRPPLAVTRLGCIKKLALALKQLQNDHLPLFHIPAVCNDPVFRCNPMLTVHPVTSCGHWEHRSRSHGNHQNNKTDSLDPDYWSSQEDDDDYSPGRGSDRSSNGKERSEMKPEAWKAVVAMAYFFCVTWITAFVMVFVHDRVPDMATYPPLPDIFLDSVPLIPWAFQMCELCGLILFLMWCCILIFHKHRFILLRRMFSLFGSVFLLRCVTMLITSLSVPGRHLECKARPYGSWSERLHQAYLIWSGGGMSLQGVRTCGDYMFSGHTVVLTLLNFFITEYTPPTLYFIHTLSWVLNLFGIFFILAGHEHYSIDVFIAFYISTRLFLYYHTLANTRALYQPDRQRTKVWFPLFSFFESGVRDIVPNQFEHHSSKFKNVVRAFTVWRTHLKQKDT